MGRVGCTFLELVKGCKLLYFSSVNFSFLIFYRKSFCNAHKRLVCVTLQVSAELKQEVLMSLIQTDPATGLVNKVPTSIKSDFLFLTVVLN